MDSKIIIENNSSKVISTTTIVSLKFKCGTIEVDRRLLINRFEYPGFSDCKEAEFNYCLTHPNILSTTIIEFDQHLYDNNYHKNRVSRQLAELLIYFMPKYQVYIYWDDFDLIEKGVATSKTPNDTISELLININKFDINNNNINLKLKIISLISIELLIENLPYLDHECKKQLITERLHINRSQLTSLIKEFKFNDVVSILSLITEKISTYPDHYYHYTKRRKIVNSVFDDLLEKNHWNIIKK